MSRGVANNVGARARKLLRGNEDTDDESDGKRSHGERYGSKRSHDKKSGSKKPRSGNSRDGFEMESSSIDWFIGMLLLTLVIFALSPGILLTIPPGRGKLWMSGLTSTSAALIHAVIIALVIEYIL